MIMIMMLMMMIGAIAANVVTYTVTIEWVDMCKSF